jgi:hypothetical protein
MYSQSLLYFPVLVLRADANVLGWLPRFNQARERLTSYRGRMQAKVCWKINEETHPDQCIMRDCGLIPIMIRVSTTPIPIDWFLTRD